MGEIKSSIELAMERSRRFALTDEEREEIKRKEIEEKASRLFHRFLEGSLSLQDMEREMERMDESHRARLSTALCQRLIDALTLEGDYERVLSGIEWLKGSPLEGVRNRLRDLASKFAEERKRAEEKVRMAMMEELQRLGLSGNAIELDDAQNPETNRLRAAIEEAYQDQVRQIQEALRNR